MLMYNTVYSENCFPLPSNGILQGTEEDCGGDCFGGRVTKQQEVLLPPRPSKLFRVENRNTTTTIRAGAAAAGAG